MTRTYTFFSIMACLWAGSFFSFSAGPEPKTKAQIEAKVDSILALMTLEEKIGQLSLFTSDWDQTGPTLRPNYKADIQAGKVGAIFNAHTADYNRKLQRMAVEETRLGIPLIFGYDVIHGYKTIFPVPLGEAASWDLELMEQSARVAAVEASAAGLHWTFAPMVDIAKDPRWGRICEGAGEDTYLGSQIAAVRVRGFQGDDLTKENTILACAKHFAAYGAAQAGRDYHTVDISKRVLWQEYLPPFKAAKDAGVRTYMTSFNELDGVPASGSKYLLTEILRDEWEFDGFVVTDYTSINEMVDHGVVVDEKEAAELALLAGSDMDMQSAAYYNHLEQSVKEGKVTEAQVEEAVRRILRLKFELGLFDDPYRYSDLERQKAKILAPEHLALAREVAQKSMVLLKNDDQTLPLSNALSTLAVIGPLADSKEDMLGSWHGAGSKDDCVSLMEGLKAKLGKQTKILHAKGCEVQGDDQSGFEEALELVKQANAVVVAVGEKWWMSGEAASRTQLDLPGVQEELCLQLIEVAKAQNKPLAIVLMNGRPLAFPELANSAPAILETWYSGTQGGHAIADVLFGDYNPSGKLPVTFPRSVGQIPIFYNMKNTGRPMDPKDKYTSKYLDESNSPLYAFGHGLSYTTFEYSSVKADKMQFGLSDKLRVQVTVKNTGKYTGEETVQLYIRDLVGSVTRPVKELKGFKKISLEPGASQKVDFTISADDLAFYTRDMTFKAEPGTFDIFIGGSSETTNHTTVELK